MPEIPDLQTLSAYLQPGAHDDYDNGYIMLLVDAQGQIIDSAFTFDEPYDQPSEVFITEHLQREWPGVTIDYARCHVITNPLA